MKKKYCIFLFVFFIILFELNCHKIQSKRAEKDVYDDFYNFILGTNKELKKPLYSNKQDVEAYIDFLLENIDFIKHDCKLKSTITDKGENWLVCMEPLDENKSDIEVYTDKIPYNFVFIINKTSGEISHFINFLND